MTDENFSEIARIIKEAQKVAIVTHTFPDGDALGSQFGLGHILKDLGKSVVLYSEEPITYLYDFLPRCTNLVHCPPSPDEVDCVVALDCGDRFRLGKTEAVEQLLKIKPFIAIDHHAGHKDYGDLRWVEPGRASTGDMVYDLSQRLGADLSYKAAYCLYAAIVSDTGSFKYASTTPDTFRIAGKLLAKGVRPEDVSGKLFDNFTENRLHLLQEVLASMELYEHGKLAFISATKKMFEMSGAEPADTETFINYPRSLATVKVAALIKEFEGVIGVSMRSKGGKYDVAAVARRFDGGGHRNAAGCKFRSGETMKEVRDLIYANLLYLVQDEQAS